MSLLSKVKVNNTNYDLAALQAQGIYYGEVDSTSTDTVFTATIPGITEYRDGTCILLRNGVITSASGFTININGLGAKPSYNNMTLGNSVTPTNPTRDTTIFNINYAMLFIYNSTVVSGGCWICYRGYDANSNTIGYQVRTNNSTMKAADKFYRYRLLFTSADGHKWVPANTSTSTNTTSKRDVNQRPIDPFGEIVYYGSTSVIDANENVTSTQLWQQYYGSYTNIGYSFNRTGAAATMTAASPIYIKCTPQSDGSAVIDPDTPYTQTLPSSEDGYIYIYLGRAVNATLFEILISHPVYYYKDGAIRLWTNAAAPASTAGVFYATFDSTSGADIKAAHDADTAIYCIKNGYIYSLTSYQYDSINDYGVVQFQGFGSVSNSVQTSIILDFGLNPEWSSWASETYDLVRVEDVKLDNTSVLSNAIASISTGTGLTSSSGTINHSNSVTAQTTQAVYPIKIDAQGHISDYGSAVTIPTVTDTYSSTSSNAMSGKAVNAALQTLDSSISATTGEAISAVTITDGKISASSKIAVGDANQNAFSKVKVGSSTIAAASTTDTVELVAGTNITLTPDTTNKKVTVGVTNQGVSDVTVNGSSVVSSGIAAIAGDLTDTKNTAGSTDTSSKIYLVGATTQATYAQTYSDNQVYATNGQLDANKVRIAEHATLQYNSTDNAIEFVFA